MPRKSTITRKPAQVRALIDKLIREDRLTLDEMRAYVDGKFPGEAPARATLHRYQAGMKEISERMRAQDVAARAIVSEFGENPDDRAGALMVQAVTTVMTDVALRTNEQAETSIDDARKLARAAKDTIAARTSSLKERQAIEQAAREKLLREQAAQLDKVVKTGGLSQEKAAEFRKKILGIG